MKLMRVVGLAAIFLSSNVNAETRINAQSGAKRNLIGAAAALALLSSSSAFAVNPTILVQSGGWTAYYTISTDNTPMCGLNIAHTRSARLLLFKWFLGSGRITAHLYKQSWRIPADAKIPVEIGMDKFTLGTATAAPLDGNAVEFTMSGDVMEEWFKAFPLARVLWIKFGEGNEQPWLADMVGSSNVMSAFQKCVLAVSGRNKSTQPYSSSSPQTQPFGSRPAAPSRPFAKPVPTQRVKPADDGSI